MECTFWSSDQGKKRARNAKKELPSPFIFVAKLGNFRCCLIKCRLLHAAGLLSFSGGGSEPPRPGEPLNAETHSPPRKQTIGQQQPNMMISPSAPLLHFKRPPTDWLLRFSYYRLLILWSAVCLCNHTEAHYANEKSKTRIANPLCQLCCDRGVLWV